jgi:hypothetical protein
MKMIYNKKPTKILSVLFLLIALVFLPESFHAQRHNNGYPSPFDRHYVTQSSQFNNQENEFGHTRSRFESERGSLRASSETALEGSKCMECGGIIGSNGHCTSCGWPFANDSITGELPLGNELWVLFFFGVVYLMLRMNSPNRQSIQNERN